MTLASIFSLFGAMMALAIVPDASVLAVVARSVASGLWHGVVVVLGIIAGDVIFILLAIYGLSALSGVLGDLFVFVKYAGAAYLIYLGVLILRSQSSAFKVEDVQAASWISSFLSGLFLTLSDAKAILFYMSFLPAFLDLSAASFVDIVIVISLAGLTIGFTKLGYAYFALKGEGVFLKLNSFVSPSLIAGVVLIGVGIYLAVRS